MTTQTATAPGAASPAEHPVPAVFHRRTVSCLVVGCGGNGARMLIRLATIDRALRALGHPGLAITACDGDLVEAHNCVRQPFALADVGLPKAAVLAHRINAAHGTALRAEIAYATAENLGAVSARVSGPGLLISCVDTARARAEVWAYVRSASPHRRPRYWMDLGNGHRTGQFVLGTTRPDAEVPLPTAAERWPEIVDPASDPAPAEAPPSCSSAEALHRQDLFVNDLLACAAAHLVWTMLRAPAIRMCGGFCNLTTGRVVPIPVLPPTRPEALRAPPP